MQNTCGKMRNQHHLLVDKITSMKLINGYTNYFITDDGRVWNNNKHKFLKANFDGRFVMVGLYLDGKRTQHRIHRLVAEYFIQNPDNYPKVKHKNGVKTDNNFSNLEWTTEVSLSKEVKDECINFANYCATNAYNFNEEISIKDVRELIEGEWYVLYYGIMTTEQLYELYLKSK